MLIFGINFLTDLLSYDMWHITHIILKLPMTCIIPYNSYGMLNGEILDWKLKGWIRPLELPSGSPLPQKWKFSLRWSLFKIILIYFNAQLKIKRVPSPGVYFLKKRMSRKHGSLGQIIPNSSSVNRQIECRFDPIFSNAVINSSELQ